MLYTILKTRPCKYSRCQPFPTFRITTSTDLSVINSSNLAPPGVPTRSLLAIQPLPLLPQHPHLNLITIPAIIPRRPSNPALDYKPEPLIQFHSAFIPLMRSDADAMQIRMPKSPLKRPQNSFRPISFALIRRHDANSDRRIAMVRLSRIRSEEGQCADWDGFARSDLVKSRSRNAHDAAK